MKKFEEKDFYNCSSCGYGSCQDMAYAIFNRLNKPENCHHYKNYMVEAEKKHVMEEQANVNKTLGELRTTYENLKRQTANQRCPPAARGNNIQHLYGTRSE